ncbi:MAG: ABC transporter permease [bacterium]|nr:ABC transporter permease [bacterium]
MTQYFVRRLLLTIPMLIGITLVLFLLYNLIQIDPLTVIIPDVGFKNPQAVENAIREWGLDKPLPQQYLTYLANIVRGDLGTSFVTRNPVMDDLRTRLPATIELAVAALLFAGVVGIPVGLLAGFWRGSLFDRFWWLVSLINACFPPFWIGLVLLTVFWYNLDIAAGPGRLPARMDYPPTVTGFMTVDALLAGRWDAFFAALSHLVLPTIVLGGYTLAVVLRLTRAAIIEEMRKEYIRTARSKGLRERTVLLRHALRNVLLPLVTLLGLAFASLLGGAVMTETIFDWPGLGQYLVKASINLDYPAIQGGTLLIATTYILVNLLVDLLYGVLDPRVRDG